MATQTTADRNAQESYNRVARDMNSLVRSIDSLLTNARKAQKPQSTVNAIKEAYDLITKANGAISNRLVVAQFADYSAVPRYT